MTIQPTPTPEVATTQPTDLTVTGEKYMLRFAVPEDAERLYALAVDPAVTRFFSWGPYTSIEQPLKYIEDLQAKRDHGSLLEFVIVDRSTDDIVGVTGLTEFSKRDHRAVVGSWLGHRYWGTGVNVASKSLILGLGFRTLDLGRISSYCHVRNGRSKSALERIGFVPEGILHAWHWHHGEPQDVYIHCLQREIYERSEIGRDELVIEGTMPPAFVV